MQFEQALHIIKSGGKVCRAGASAGHAFIYLHQPTVRENDFEPFVALRGTADVGAPLLPYNFSTTDVLSDEWYEVSSDDNGLPAELVIAADNVNQRQRELTRATTQAQHWEMMDNLAQAAAWRDYYQALYALDTTPDWPYVAQWPEAPR